MEFFYSASSLCISCEQHGMFGDDCSAITVMIILCRRENSHYSYIHASDDARRNILVGSSHRRASACGGIKYYVLERKFLRSKTQFRSGVIYHTVYFRFADSTLYRKPYIACFVPSVKSRSNILY